MKKRIVLLAIIMMFATCAANAASNQVSVKLRFEIPKYVNVNWFPDNDGNKDKDDRKEKKEKKDKKYETPDDYAADMIDTIDISSNCAGKIVMSVDGEETEYGFAASDDGGKTIEKMRYSAVDETPEGRLDEIAGAAKKPLVEKHQIAITILADL